MEKGISQQREWFRITRNTAEEIDIDIYGDIGESVDWWTGEKSGIGAKSFLDALRDAKGKAVNLHINSAGGSVVDAYAMMTAIANHDGKVTAYIDGLAASAASYLVAAADEVIMSSVAWMMIHEATVFCWGGAQEMRDTADYLEKTNRHIAEIYGKRSDKKDVEDFVEAMAATTWFDADEALSWGLVDSIEEAVAAAACFTTDAVAWNTAPDNARKILFKGLADDVNLAGNYPGAIPASDGLGDTSDIIPNDVNEPAAQEPAAAQERAVVVDGKLVKVNERKEKNA